MRALIVPLLIGAAVVTSALVDGLPPVRGDAQVAEGSATDPKRYAPSVAAAFQDESYAPQATATLRFFNGAPTAQLQLFRAGPERRRTFDDNEMLGVPVTQAREIGSVDAGSIVRVRIGSWPSGVYFARLTAGDGRIGFAPFVLRPSELGEHRVAVVMPTFTWQAYNRRDDDGDGVGDSWYADPSEDFARLYRPHLNRGVPYHFRTYDRPFLAWLVKHRKRVDFLADSDLDAVGDGASLVRAYDLVVFPGHHEYVTENEYDAIEAYRDRGGNLAFLSANNLFYRVVKHGPLLERTQKWRDLGRPEAALVGVQYIAWKRAFGRYVVRDVPAARWLFRSTGLEPGDTFGHGGIEIDAVAPSSPRSVQVVARIRDVFGPGLHAEMTVYRTRAGATVFAAGAFTLGGAALSPQVSQIVENLWKRLAR